MHLVRTGSTAGLEQLVRDMGHNPIDLIKSVGLTQAQFRDPNQYIDYHKMTALLGACSEVCNAPQFGLLLAQTQTTIVLGDLPMISSRARTVGEAVSAINRFLYLHASGVSIDTGLHRHQAQIRLSINIGEPPGMAQLLQLSTAHLAMYIAELLNADTYCQAIHLTQADPAPSDTSANLRFSNLRYGQTFDGISFPCELLQRPTHHDEEALNNHLQRYLTRLQTLYPDNLENQVAAVIGRLLPSGECSIETVAATLNVHPRTLQERLRAQQTGYRKILQQKRYELAIQQLAKPNANITELALQLGYAELAVFSRHFKQWTGLSPRAWRQVEREA
tara:strand:+ start:55799 stop:56800 length:1002 start_codon:yes stop_codon:yes gene_type:complete